MKQLTIFEAEDGSRWDVMEDAIRRDILHQKVQALLVRVPKTPDAAGLRIPIAEPSYWAVKRGLVALARECYPGETVFHDEAEKVHVYGWAGRFLSEVGGPLQDGWWWLSCVGESGPAPMTRYLYNQPYYALHPGEWRPT